MRPDQQTALWRKSSYSNGDGGDCIEVADGVVGVQPIRDSKDPSGPVLLFAADAFASFVQGVKAGEFGDV